MAWNPRKRTPAKWLDLIEAKTAGLREDAERLRLASEGGPVSFSRIDRFLDHLSIVRELLDGAIAEGETFRQYAVFARGGTVSEVLSDFNAMRTAIQETGDWIVANIPKSGPYLLVLSYAADWSRSWRTFGTVATAEFRTRLQTLETAIGG